MAEISLEAVHKRRREDVFITNLRPHPTEKDAFQADFASPASDHFMGTRAGHVKGITMIEAIQQTARAIRHLALRDKREGFLFRGLSINFKRLLPSDEKAVVTLKYGAPKEIQITMAEGRVPATLQPIEGRITDSSGNVVAIGKGRGIVYDIKAAKK